MADIQISVINASTVLTDDQASAAVPALQTQVHRDFAPVWGVDADLTFVPAGSTPAKGSWWLAILDNSDQAGALGYHDLTNEGLPLGKVFAGTDLQYNQVWTVTASHELLEMLGDPDINLSVLVQNQDGSGLLYAYEVCDACEADSLGYRINGTLVSDFVYPSWFESFRTTGSTQFDYASAIQSPFQLVAGGYIGVFNITAGTGWTQLTAKKEEQRYQMRAPIGSRRERRRTPREQWMRSLLHTTRKGKAKGAHD
jgi:hypothetical protein